MSTAAAKRYLYSHFGGSTSPPNPVQKHAQPESEVGTPPPSSPTKTSPETLVQKDSDSSNNCKHITDDSFVSSNLNDIKMESESSINILAAAAVAAQQFPLTNHHHHDNNLFQTKLIDQNQSIPFNGSITNGVPIANMSAFHHHHHQLNSSSNVEINSRSNDGDNNLFYLSKLIPPPPPPHHHHLTTGSDSISNNGNSSLLNFGSLSPYFYHQYQQLYHHLNHSFWANSGSNLSASVLATDAGSSNKQTPDDDDNDDGDADSAMNLVNKCKDSSTPPPPPSSASPNSGSSSPTNEIRVVDAHVPVIASTASYKQLSTSNKSNHIHQIENSDFVQPNNDHCAEHEKKLVDRPPPTSKSMDDEGIDVDMEIDIGCNPSPPTSVSSSTVVSNQMDQPTTTTSSVNQSRTSIKASATIANQKQQPKFLSSPTNSSTDNGDSASKTLQSSCSSSSDTSSDHYLSPTGSTGSSTSTNSLEQSSKRTLYQCQWSGCQFQCLQCHMIDQHVRVMHLKPNSKTGDAVATSSSEEMADSAQKLPKKLMGPKHRPDLSNTDDNDDDMSDQELCFNEMEIISEDELIDHNSSPQTTLSSMSSLSAVSTLSAGLSPGLSPCSPQSIQLPTAKAMSNQNDHSQSNLVSSPSSLSSTTKIVAVPQSSTDDVPMDLSLGAKTVGKPLSLLLPPPQLTSVTKVTTNTSATSTESSSSVAVAADLMVMVLNDKNDENPNHNPVVSGQPPQPTSISATNTTTGHVNVASTIIPPRMFHFVPSASPSSLSSSSSSSSCSSSSSSSTSAYFSSTSSPTSSTKSWSAQYDISNNNNGAAVVPQITKPHLPTTTIQSQSTIASSNTTSNVEPVSLVRNRLATPPPPPQLESTTKPIMVINHKSSNVIKYGHAQTPATPTSTVRVNEEELKRVCRKEDAVKGSAFMVPMMNHHHNNNLHYLNHHHHLYNHTYMATPNNTSSNGITVPIKSNNKNLTVMGEGVNQTTSNGHSLQQSMINQSGATHVVLPRRRGRPPGSTNKKKKLLLQQQQQQQQQHQQLICAMNPLNGTPFIASIAASLSPSNGAAGITKSSPQKLEFPVQEKFAGHHQSQDSHSNTHSHHHHHHHPLFGSLKGLVGAMGAAAAAAAAASGHHHRATNPLGIISPSLNNGSTSSLTNGASVSASAATVANRRPRGESRKCRKVYGMDNRQLWCTQCKWKKACSRFID